MFQVHEACRNDCFTLVCQCRYLFVPSERSYVFLDWQRQASTQTHSSTTNTTTTASAQTAYTNTATTITTITNTGEPNSVLSLW